MLSILLLLIGIVVYLNITYTKEITKLKIKLDDINEKETLIASYSEELPKIKELKQKIMGQENKIEEFSSQIQEVTNLLESNNEKLDKLRNN